MTSVSAYVELLNDVTGYFRFKKCAKMLGIHTTSPVRSIFS